MVVVVIGVHRVVDQEVGVLARARAPAAADRRRSGTRRRRGTSRPCRRRRSGTRSSTCCRAAPRRSAPRSPAARASPPGTKLSIETPAARFSRPFERAVVRRELVLQRRLERRARDRVRAEDPDLVALDEERREERQALDVIEVRVREQDRQLALPLAELAAHQRASRARSRRCRDRSAGARRRR